MPRKPPADQPHLAPLKIEGQPWHEDPEVMAKVIGLTDLNTTVQTDAAAPSAQAVFDAAGAILGEPIDMTGWKAVGDAVETTENATLDSTANPYLLESSAILGELAYEAVRARAVIQQLDAEIDHLTQDAAFQVRRIEARRDIELEQRNRRKDDLMKIVSADIMLNGDKGTTDD